MNRGRRQAFHSDFFLPDSERSFEVLSGHRLRASELVEDAQVEKTIRTRDVHRLEFRFSDGQGFTEAGDGFVRQVLLEVVQADQEVGVACLQTVGVEQLLNELDVADVGFLALDLHADRVVKGSHEPKRLQHPSIVFVHEDLFRVALRLALHASSRT